MVRRVTFRDESTVPYIMYIPVHQLFLIIITPQPTSKDTCTVYIVEAERGLNNTSILALIHVNIKLSKRSSFNQQTC